MIQGSQVIVLRRSERPRPRGQAWESAIGAPASSRAGIGVCIFWERLASHACPRGRGRSTCATVYLKSMGNYSLLLFGRRFPRRALRGPSPSPPSVFSPLGPGLFTFGNSFASSAFTLSYFLSFARFVHSYGSLVSSYSSSPPFS